MSLYKKYKIIKKVKENDSVVSLYLEPEEKSPLLKFKPGQHLMFKVYIPGDAIHHFRYYSFSDSFNGRYYRISVKKENSPGEGILPGKCSTFLYHKVEEGDVLEAKGPSGDFCIVPGDKEPLVLIAGGIGITPLLSMVKAISQENHKRKVYFFYGVNGKEDHSFQREIQELRKENPNFHIATFYARVNSEDVKGQHFDFEGFISLEKILEKVPNHKNLDYYICGPAAMMDYVSAGLEESGVPKDRLHFESFSSKTSENASEDEILNSPMEKNGEERFEIEFTKSQKKLKWNGKYDSILEFAEDHDIEIPSGCLFGDCGTCLTRIQSGKVKYKHPTLVEPGAGECLPCSSVPLSNIILEV